MNDIIITTLPLMPRKNINYEHYIIPTLVEQIGRFLNAQTNLMVNNLGNYQDHDVRSYLENIAEKGLAFDNVMVDRNYLSELKKSFIKLIDEGKIIEKEIDLCKCECGKINIIKDGIRNYSNGDFYNLKEDGAFCTHCGTKLFECKQKSLVIENIGNYIADCSYPLAYDKQIARFYDQRKNSDILVSKARKTGIEIEVNGTNYNIDVDFIWANFPNLFSAKNIVIVNGTTLLYESFIVNLVNQMHGNKNLIILHTSRINNIAPLKEKIMAFDNNSSKLNICFNASFKSIVSNWQENICRFLNSCRPDETQMLLKMKCITPIDIVTPTSIGKCIDYGFNFNNNVMTMKSFRTAKQYFVNKDKTKKIEPKEF